MWHGRIIMYCFWLGTLGQNGKRSVEVSSSLELHWDYSLYSFRSAPGMILVALRPQITGCFFLRDAYGLLDIFLCPYSLIKFSLTSFCALHVHLLIFHLSPLSCSHLHNCPSVLLIFHYSVLLPLFVICYNFFWQFCSGEKVPFISFTFLSSLFQLLIFATASSNAPGSGASGFPGLLVRFPARYCAELYIGQEGATHFLWRFISLPKDQGRLSIVCSHHSWDTSARACRKRRKPQRGQVVSDSRLNSSKVDVPFVCCTEEVSHQRKFEELLASWRRDGVAPAVIDVYYYCLDETWSQLWFFARSRYWAHEHQFGKRLCMRYSFLVYWQNI